MDTSTSETQRNSEHGIPERGLREQALDLVVNERYEEAEALYQQLRQQDGDTAQLLNNHAVVCGALGQLERKRTLLEQAIALDPAFREARFNLAATHLQRQDGASALAAYQALLAEEPQSAAALRGVGRAHALLHQPPEALEALQRACDLAPDEVQHRLDLARVQRSVDRSVEAEATLRRATELDPGHGLVARELAALLHEQGRVEEAITTMRNALDGQPDNYELLVDLGGYLQEIGRVEQSLDYLFYAISLEPSRSAAIARTAVSMLKLHDIQQAMQLLTLAESLDPLDSQTLNLLGICLSDSGLPSQALSRYQQGLEHQPDNTEILSNLVATQLRLGQIDASIATGLRALEIEPYPEHVVNTLMFTYAAQADRCNAQALTLGAGYSRHLRAKLPAQTAESLQRPAFASASPRQLRVGFLSAEIGSHVVGGFLEAFVRYYDRSSFHVELLSMARRFEARGAELAGYVDGAHSLEGLLDEPAREFIRERQYDILIDTSGFTRCSGIRLLVQRCAPIQCHYIGFHATTGIDSIDYFIGDDDTAAADLQPQFVETLWRLPRPWLAATPGEPPPAAIALAETAQPVLGSFNQLAKIREQTLEHWSAAMLAVPEAILLIKDRLCADDPSCQRILAAMTEAGVSADRIRFLGATATHQKHLETYNRIDIALDATPWSSATTGFDALKMGVPLVAIRGQCMAARMSSSLVRAVGHPEWIADSPQQFASIVAALCSDIASVRRQKPALQTTTLRSSLFDAPDLARQLGQALQGMATAGLTPA